MIAPSSPIDEFERIEAVRSYFLLDTLPQEEYDNITSLIASVCDTPISLVTLLDTDRNFLKSHHGVPFNESPRNISFCGHAILEEADLFVIEDARMDPRFMNNPLVIEHNAVFYAGAPLIAPSGHKLGTLCVFDTKPKKLTDNERNFIVAMAKQVVKLFELHKNNKQLTALKKQLEERNQNLRKFASLVSHDLKSPLANITSLARVLKEEYEIRLDEDANQYLDYIEESSEKLKKYIDGMLLYYKSDEIISEKKEEVQLQSIFTEIKDIMFVDNAEFKHTATDTTLYINRAALMQILLNLVGNALKYNHDDVPYVTVTFDEDSTFYHFAVKDNGLGIDKEKQELIFDLFKTTGAKDRHGNNGSGIGLATVKNLVSKLGGNIVLDSKIGKGTTFSFTIRK